MFIDASILDIVHISWTDINRGCTDTVIDFEVVFEMAVLTAPSIEEGHPDSILRYWSMIVGTHAS